MGGFVQRGVRLTIPRINYKNILSSDLIYIASKSYCLSLKKLYLNIPCIVSDNGLLFGYHNRKNNFGYIVYKLYIHSDYGM